MDAVDCVGGDEHPEHGTRSPVLQGKDPMELREEHVTEPVDWLGNVFTFHVCYLALIILL